MKSILLSNRPKETSKLLNGDLSVLVRKKFPEDFVGWVYIYCTKKANQTLFEDVEYCPDTMNTVFKGYAIAEELCCDVDKSDILNGKVVARFWCDKVEEILHKPNGNYYTNFLSNRKLLTQSCLTQEEIFDYTAGNWHQKFSYWYGGYVIHISKLEIFDKPKELSEFGKCELLGCCDYRKCNNCRHHIKLTKAPQNYCYVEEE